LCFLLPVLTGACYRYVPAQSPEPGRLIRASLNEQGAAAVTPRLGPGVLELDGLLLANEEQELSVLVESYITRMQGTLSAGNEPVRLPHTHFSTVLEREIDPVRSALFGTALVAGAVAMVQVFGPGGIVFRDEDPPDDPPVEIVVPVRLLGRLFMKLGGMNSP
jgi:hypothetical protein